MVVLPAPPVQETLTERDVPQAEATTAASLAVPQPVFLPAAVRSEIHVVRAMPQPRSKPADIPAPPARLAAAVTAPPPPPAAVVSQDVMAGLKSRIRQAVQDAAVFPPSARLMHREGRAQVRFDYIDGAADSATLAASSESAILDAAALAAVRRAILPRAPAEIGHRKLDLLVWVDFTLTRQN